IGNLCHYVLPVIVVIDRPFYVRNIRSLSNLETIKRAVGDRANPIAHTFSVCVTAQTSHSIDRAAKLIARLGDVQDVDAVLRPQLSGRLRCPAVRTAVDDNHTAGANYSSHFQEGNCDDKIGLWPVP